MPTWTYVPPDCDCSTTFCEHRPAPFTIEARQTDGNRQLEREMDEQPERRLALGTDSAPVEPKDERRRRQWREAGKRRRQRVKAAEGLGLFFPHDVPRGLGDLPGSGRKPVVDDPKGPLTPDELRRRTIARRAREEREA